MSWFKILWGGYIGFRCMPWIIYNVTTIFYSSLINKITFAVFIVIWLIITTVFEIAAVVILYFFNILVS